MFSLHFQAQIPTTRSVLLACGLLWCLLAGSHAASAAPGSIIIQGSTTAHPLVKRIAREFMKDHPGPQISVAAGGSGEGFKALLAGEADIASSSRFISDQELSQAMKQGVYPVPFRIADDCIVPVVHKRNKLKALSQEQLQKIYTGEVSNWKQLGGADIGITVISRSPGSGTFGVWRDIIMHQADLTDTVLHMDASDRVVRAVSDTRGAIGYISLGFLSASVKPLRVNGVMASLHSVRDGSYLLSRPLFMFTPGWPDRQVLEFINYALNPDKGQAIVRKSGFMPVHSDNNW